MPIEARKIPQNVYIEDRIIGPLTLRQIIIMALGGGFSYAIYASSVKAFGGIGIVATVIIWTPAVLCAAFALVKINDLSLMRMLLLTIERLLKAPIRTWAPRTGISINIKVLAESEKEKRRTPSTVPEHEAQQKIEELSSMIDSAFVDKNEPAAPAAAVLKNEEDTAVRVTSMAEKRTLPVNKSRISVDSPGMDTTKNFSDFSVFRDILPPTQA